MNIRIRHIKKQKNTGWQLDCRAAGSKVNWHVACQARWIKSDAGMSHAEAAGSKVTLACRMPGPLDQKWRWHVACRGRWIESIAGMSHAEAAGSKVALACRMPGMHIQ